MRREPKGFLRIQYKYHVCRKTASGRLSLYGKAAGTIRIEVTANGKDRAAAVKE
jgi:hypothetical protein